MLRWRRPLSPQTRALLARERLLTPLPGSTRARAVARARAALDEAPVAPPISLRRPRTIGWAAAAALVCLATMAAGAAAYEVGIRAQVTPTAAAPPPPSEQPAPSGARVGPSLRGSPPAAPPREPAPSRAADARAELRLLQRAQAAVARGDFAAAMRPLTEHARRFGHGWLAQEREALRVKALWGLGRVREARRAADDFELHFPRSPLLPAVGLIVGFAP
jgi:hypothetical protein